MIVFMLQTVASNGLKCQDFCGRRGFEERQGLNQSQLGDALGLTFQQVQKYERGSNRISASRLFHLSKILDVPVSYFYEDMPDELGRKSPLR